MSELTKTAEKDLIKEIADMRESLREFRFSVSGSKVRNIREARSLRKDIARRLTELNRRSKEVAE